MEGSFLVAGEMVPGMEELLVFDLDLREGKGSNIDEGGCVLDKGGCGKVWGLGRISELFSSTWEVWLWEVDELENYPCCSFNIHAFSR